MVVQISVDIMVTNEEYNGSDIAETVAETLEMFDYKVLGSAWKATWTDEGYSHSQPPISSD